MDTWAPMQFVTQPQVGNTDVSGGTAMNAQGNTVDTTINYKIGGTVIGALLLVFALHYLGFRFVVGAGVGK